MALGKKYPNTFINLIADQLVIDDCAPKIINEDDIGGNIVDEPILGIILITWNTEKSIKNVNISYSKSYWMFHSVTDISKLEEDKTDIDSFVSFVYGKLAMLVRSNTDVRKIFSAVSEADDTKMLLDIGFTEINSSLYVADLYEVEYKTSKLEEYFNWVNTGKSPNLEPSWRKVID